MYNILTKCLLLAGNDKSHELLKDIYGVANGFIVMYDITDIQSYNDVYEW